MHLYLIRHGQSHVNLEGWEHGNTDEGLTELGLRQVEALARWLIEAVPTMDALYTSTMRRARETAEVLASAYGCAVCHDHRLREVGNNRLDHSPWPADALPREYAPYRYTEHPFAPTMVAEEGAESWMHFRTRVGAFIEESLARHPEQTIVAVCHGGVIGAAFDHIFNIGPWRRCRVWTQNTGVTHFEYVQAPERQMWRLHCHDRVDHLRGLDTSMPLS